MWQVDNQTPFGALGYFVRDRAGAEHWVLAVRAGYLVNAAGEAQIADEQPPPRLAPDYADERAEEMSAEADLAPFRPLVDVTLSGVACRPGLVRARSCDVGVEIGGFRKMARVFGPRQATRRNDRLIIDGPDEFDRLSLTWRAALGGKDAFAKDPAGAVCEHNPIGKGFIKDWNALRNGDALPLPEIENPAQLIVPGQKPPPPHGFGPLMRAWRPRVDHAGTYDGAWQAARAPLPPEDFDDKFHQAAPADQQISHEAVAQVRLAGFHPDGPYGFELPRVTLKATTKLGAEQIESRFKLIGLHIRASHRRFDMVWNASVPCNGRDHQLKWSRVRLLPRVAPGMAG